MNDNRVSYSGFGLRDMRAASLPSGHSRRRPIDGVLLDASEQYRAGVMFNIDVQKQMATVPLGGIPMFYVRRGSDVAGSKSWNFKIDKIFHLFPNF